MLDHVGKVNEERLHGQIWLQIVIEVQTHQMPLLPLMLQMIRLNKNPNVQRLGPFSQGTPVTHKTEVPLIFLAYKRVSTEGEWISLI